MNQHTPFEPQRPADLPAETAPAMPAVPAVDAAAVVPLAADPPLQASVGAAATATAVPAPVAAPALTAAQDAADFVARIFADTGLADVKGEAQAKAETEVAHADPAASALPAPEEGADTLVDPELVSPAAHAAAPAPAELPPVPAGWPASANTAAGDSTALPLHGQHVLVLGLGASGLAMARWCVRCGARVTVADTRTAPPQLAALKQELPQVRFVAGALDARLVEGQGVSAVYRSPGLSPAEVAPVLIAAGASGVSAGGELDLYSMALQALRKAHGYAPAVLAVTGTNGKTTVTALTAHTLAHAGRTVAMAGNIGPTLLDTLAAHIDAGTLPQVWVLELSSFQLDGCNGFEPTAAVLLNLTQDHLDWHGDMAAYGAAKARIFGTHTLRVLNREDPAVVALRFSAPATATEPQAATAPERKKIGKSTKTAVPTPHPCTTFGGDLPQRPGDFGIETVNGMTWLVRALEADETRQRGGKRGALQEAPPLHLQRLMPADALRIRGRHNATNALAALALAQAAGCTLAELLYGLREYRGEPHRVESIGVLDGVEWFDDSKGTNVGATVAALSGLGAERSLVVILGGLGKGQDFAPLAVPVARHVRAAVLIGRDAPLVRAALADTGVLLLDAADMADAVQQACAQARAGDAVLLSPACSSFDMYDSYVHRAQVFCAAVQALAEGAGSSLEGAA